MRPTQQDQGQTKILRKMGGLFISSYLNHYAVLYPESISLKKYIDLDQYC